MSESPIGLSESSSESGSVLDICQDQHRRIVLAVLAEEQRSLTVNDLTKAVLKYNRETPVTEVSDEVLTEIRRSLLREHLPLLESAAVIKYDSDRQHVEPSDRFDRLQPSLSAIVDLDPTLEEPVEL